MEPYVRIFDTTLRDGEQSPGATMTSAEKLEVARSLARLGVDIIEAGFPAASPDDLEAVRRIAIEVGNPADGTRPAGDLRSGPRHPQRHRKAWEAVRPAARPRIHTFLATSDIHMQYKLRMTREQVVQRVREMVAYARSLCADVEFSPEDAGRSDPEFLYQVLGEAIQAGATTLNIPDTVGYTLPDEFGALIAGIIRHTPGVENCVVSVHCHNDLGLATANTLAGIQRRGAPGRGDHQRHRRAGRQHRPGRGGDGAAHPPDELQPVHRHRHHPDHPDEQAGQQLHRYRRPAQQGHRRGQCLCPRGRHPPGWHAQEQPDL